jgi:hypothetical protein
VLNYESQDFAQHQEATTKDLPLAKHFHTKNVEGDASNKYTNLQSKYAGNFAKI